jgi:hypothetical protein
MSDAEQAMPAGRTRWRRFFAVIVPAFGAVALMLYMGATGVVAVSFAVSGTPFTITADQVRSVNTDGNGAGFYQYGVTTQTGNGKSGTAVEVVIPSAQLTTLCQSVPAGPVTLRLTAGNNGTPVTATNLVSDLNTADASQAQFTNVNIGQDVGGFSNTPTGHHAAGTFGQVASGVTFTNLRQVNSGSAASLFTLPNFHASIGQPC